MNTAQRMESSSKAGAIHASEATRRLLPNDDDWNNTDGRGEGASKCSVLGRF